AETFLVSADDRANLALPIHLAQRVARSFQDINVAAFVHGNCPRIDERAVGGGRSVGRLAAFAVAGHGADDAGFQVDHSDATIVEIVKIEPLARRIETDAVNSTEARRGRWAAIAAEALFRSRNHADSFAASVELADAMV